MPGASMSPVVANGAWHAGDVTRGSRWIPAFAGMTGGSGRSDQGVRFNASTALSPPNANELLSTARTGISRAVFGT